MKESQRDAIDRVELESNEKSLIQKSVFTRLLFAPVMAFLFPFFGGGMFRGVSGLKQSVNAWALSFVTEAKRYEKDFSDDAELKKLSKKYK